MELKLSDIIVPPRQRAAEIDDHFAESIRKRLIHPIVLRQTNEGPTLVVGARRLLALARLGTDPLIENEHFRFLQNLSPDEAEIVELEENIKREEMPWRDHIQTVAKIHKIYSQRKGWTVSQTAQEISIAENFLYKILMISRKLDSLLLKNATGIAHAYSILQVAADRAAGDIVTKISAAGKEVFTPQTADISTIEEKINFENALEVSTGTSMLSTPSTISHSTPRLIVSTSPKSEPSPDIIECKSFQTWLETYAGPKFNLIHCDFPYNIDYKSYGTSITSTSEDYDTKPFNELLEAFTQNLDKFCSYQAHVVFWFSMEFYEQARLALEVAGLSVHRHPLIWFKSDNSGIVPGRDNQYTRRVYETAFLCSRGRRPLVKTLANLYSAPNPSNPIHPTQKSEPMLRHFLSMLVDENTDVFDPTCGSGSALRAADSLGARKVFGLEMNPDYARRAIQATAEARFKRRAAQ
jgi:DNA modification methylase